MIRFALFLILALFLFGTSAEASKIHATSHLGTANVLTYPGVSPITFTPDPPHQVRLQAPLTIQIDDARIG